MNEVVAVFTLLICTLIILAGVAVGLNLLYIVADRLEKYKEIDKKLDEDKKH